MDKDEIRNLKMYIKAKRFLLYTLRWQLSTPILAIVVMCLSGSVGTIGATVIANLVGADTCWRCYILLGRQVHILEAST